MKIRIMGTVENGLFVHLCVAHAISHGTINYLKFPEKSSSRKPHKQSGNDIFPWFGWR
jgi:hypothetical protein